MAPLTLITNSVSTAVQANSCLCIAVHGQPVALTLDAGVSNTPRRSGIAPGTGLTGGTLVGGGAGALFHGVGCGEGDGVGGGAGSGRGRGRGRGEGIQEGHVSDVDELNEVLK